MGHMGHVADTGFERADTAADSRPFVHRVPAHTPEWTNYNDGDPSAALLEVSSFLTSDIYAHAPQPDFTIAFADASPSLSVDWLF